MVQQRKRMVIQCPQDYDMLSSIHSWIFPDIQPVPEHTSTVCFWRVLSFTDESTPTKITQERPGRELLVEWEAHGINQNDMHSKVDRILNLKLDMNPVMSDLRKDESIFFVYDKIKGIRPYLTDTIYEALIKTIIQQQISYRAANVITMRLIHRTSSSNDTYFAFPSAEKILSLGVDGLKALGLGYKSDCIHSISNMVFKEALDLDGLVGVSHEERIEILTPIRGIGRWTVDVLAIAGIGDFAIFPYGDLGIQNLLRRLLSFKSRPTADDVHQWSMSRGANGPLILYLLMCVDVLGLMGEYGRSGKP